MKLQILPILFLGLNLLLLEGHAETDAEFQKTVVSAKAWLNAPAEDRGNLEEFLGAYGGNIDLVLEALRPKGSDAHAEIKGREVRGDTFTVPRLLERNVDHPFNFYVPSHYDPDKPMGLLLWMHGGGTYKPGKNVNRRGIGADPKDLEEGDFIAVAAEACHGVNFPEGAVPDAMAGRWSVPASERYLSDLVNEFMHRYHIDPNRIVLKGYSMGGIGAYNHAMRTDRFAAVGIGGGSWTWGTFDTMLNTPVFIWHGKEDSYWNAPGDCRNRMTDVCHARFAHEILTELGYDHVYVETDGGHNDVNRLDGNWFSPTDQFFKGRTGFMVDKFRDPYPTKVVAMTPRGSYEVIDPKTSGDPFRQAESLHDHWVSIENHTPGPVPVDHVVKEGQIKTAKSREEWLNFSAKRSRSTFQGARIEMENLGNNRFTAKTLHVDSFRLWLHPKMADLTKPIQVSVNGKDSEFTCQPSLLTALKSFERKEDWGLIYPGSILIEVK